MHGSLSFRTNSALVCTLNSPLVQLCSGITLLWHYGPFEISFALLSSLGELILKGWTCSLSLLTSHLSWNPRLKHTCTLFLRLSVPVQCWLSPLSRDPRVVSLSVSVWLCFIGCGSVWYDSSLPLSLPPSVLHPSILLLMQIPQLAAQAGSKVVLYSYQLQLF